jgi:hypothetical protein
MLGDKTQEVDAARSAASTSWVLVRLNKSGDSYTKNLGLVSSQSAVETENCAKVQFFVSNQHHHHCHHHRLQRS